MSTTSASSVAAAGTPQPRQKKARRTSLFAHGEPMVWLTGGALALSLFMIVALLLLVLIQGLGTFWPSDVVRVVTVSGKTLMGEVSRDEEFAPTAADLDNLPEAARAGASEAVKNAEGEAVRRLLRTGNFDISGTHFHWVSDFEVETEDRPEWAVVIERLAWGRFYGTPQAFVLDGERLHEGEPEAVWAQYEKHHDEIRERFASRREIEDVDIGRLNFEREHARLAIRKAELEHGKGSVEAESAVAEFERVKKTTQAAFDELSAEIKALKDENAKFQIALQTADGQEKILGLAEIVRAYPANQLGFFAKVGTYLSRWNEFLFDDPREANSEGGVWPAIFGTVVMTIIMVILVVPFGVLAALYLREYAKGGPLVSGVRIAINNLAGVPSIVFGVFGLGFFCYILGASIDELFYSESLPNPTYGKGGLLWASFTLALLTLPVVIVSTEEALAAVPGSMREGSYACGASKWQTIWRIVLPRAMPGIMTGMILAMARGAGEVAPLMLVGAVKMAPDLPVDLVDLSGSFGPIPLGPLHPDRSFMHLGFHIYDLGFQSQNSEAAKPMVFTTTLLLILIVVFLNVASIWIRGRLRRKFGGGHF